MRLFPLRARALLQLFCLLALLLGAQHGALTHALWHAHAKLPGQQGEHSEARAPHSPGVPHALGLCVFDAAFGEVLGGAPTTHHRSPAPAPSAETPLHHHVAFVVQEALAPRSRGPPSLL